MTYKRIIISTVLGCFSVLTIGFIVSIFVVSAIYSVPSIKTSSFDSLIMGVSAIAISTAIYLSIKKIIFNRFLNIKVPSPLRFHLSIGNRIIVNGCIAFSMGMSFYFRDYTFYALNISEADPGLSVSWLLSTVFLFRIFVLIAIYNEKCGQSESYSNSADTIPD